MSRRGAKLLLPALALLLGWPAASFASHDALDGTSARPVVAIIIDDVGNSLSEGRMAIALPGPVACSILPDTPFASQLADMAHFHGKEVMLHLPLQALDGGDLGPGGITLNMTQEEMDQTLRRDLAAVPYVQGVNNHMGSLLTQHPGDMTWLMKALARDGHYFFIDSFTTPNSVALTMAREQDIPTARRDVFLDDELTSTAIGNQFDRLIEIARTRGYALAIGHPHPETLRFLEDNLSRLQAAGIKLVPVSRIIGIEEQIARRNLTGTMAGRTAGVSSPIQGQGPAR